ncbi:MAG TPA: thioredoxin family protein [Stellaceae bacterium]|nr:thioredoxin family protein [Stellaceae bacterium]
MATMASTARDLVTAPDFDLEGTDGKRHRLADLKGPKATLVMFICNHCPYVKAVLDDIIAEARELQPLGVGVVAIMPNDTDAYPEDGFENMRRLAQAKSFPFPYLIDRTQDVARAYGALCTPDFFGFDAGLRLKYRGRIYALRNLQRIAGGKRELFEAMAAIAGTGEAPAEQYPSMGCSIKWRNG